VLGYFPEPLEPFATDKMKMPSKIAPLSLRPCARDGFLLFSAIDNEPVLKHAKHNKLFSEVPDIPFTIKSCVLPKGISWTFI